MISKACIPHNLDRFQDDMEQRALEFDDQKPILITPHGVLFHSDCVALFDRINDDSIDCIFADPPFNLAKDYGNGKHTDLLPDNMYLNWSRAWLSQAIRILKPGGALVVYILPRWGYHLAHYLEEMGMLFRHWIAVSMKSTFPRGRRLYPAHYSILYFSNPAAGFHGFTRG